MKLLLLATFCASIVFLIIDVIWLSFAVKQFYRPQLGPLLLDKPVMWAAALFYIIYVFGLSIVIISPNLHQEHMIKLLLQAFIFGFVAYGTYNLTNMATLKGWSPSVVIVDMFWGGFLTAFSSLSGILLAKKILF